MGNKIKFIGDVHGKFSEYKKIIKDIDHPSVVVGDFGVGFMRYDYEGELVLATNPPHDFMMERQARYIVGNHDNRSVAKKDSKWIPCGTIENDIMYIGGATSIDKAWRTEGLDWWADEENSYNDLQVMIDTYIINKPRIMVTHEVPESIADGILAALNKKKLDDPSRTRQALQIMLENHRPEIWLGGHWHVDIDQVINGTRFVVLNELSHIDLEM